MAEPGVTSAELNPDVLNPIEVLRLFGHNRTFYLEKQIRTFKTQLAMKSLQGETNAPAQTH